MRFESFVAEGRRLRIPSPDGELRGVPTLPSLSIVSSSPALGRGGGASRSRRRRDAGTPRNLALPVHDTTSSRITRHEVSS